MVVRALIVEQLELDGTLRTFQLKPSNDHGEIVVAFAENYQESRDGPFHFLDNSDAKRYTDGFANCRARRLSSPKFHGDRKVLQVVIDWTGIPTRPHQISYYALSLPPQTIPLHLNVTDPRFADRDYPCHVSRDDERQRFVVYVECASNDGRFDFQLRCKFKLDSDKFSSAVFTHANVDRPALNPDSWRSLLPKAEVHKVQQFFIDSLHIGDRYSVGQAGAVGPNAKARNMLFQQAKHSPEPISEEEREVLISCADTGELHLLRTDEFGSWLQAGQKHFFYEGNPVRQALFLDAFQSLNRRGYLKHETAAAFRLTGAGFRLARKLAAKKETDS